jgi:hypothetical protein
VTKNRFAPDFAVRTQTDNHTQTHRLAQLCNLYPNPQGWKLIVVVASIKLNSIVFNKFTYCNPIDIGIESSSLLISHNTFTNCCVQPKKIPGFDNI